MNDQQLLRYSRHILLNEMDVSGQQRALDAHVLIVGAGGLGCAAALYLGASGVGHVTLVDDDIVELSNLQRQIGHSTDRIGQPKVHSLAAAMAALNPDTVIEPVVERANAALLDTHVRMADVVLDCTDNFTTRQLINAACVQHRKSLISGAAMRLDGQVATFALSRNESPCYACVFPPDTVIEESQCSTMGVLSPLVGIIGATQAADTLAVISGLAKSRSGVLRILDARSMEWASMRIVKNPDCSTCSPRQ